MELTFLGTGAATGFPLPFCRCAACRAAAAAGGPSLRRRSSAVVNGELLLDLGPDLTDAAYAGWVDMSALRYWVQTHAHSDHFCAGHLVVRLAEYAPEDVPPLQLAATAECVSAMGPMAAAEEAGVDLWNPAWQQALGLTVSPTAPGQPVRMGRYTVTALPAAHDPTAGAAIYLVDDGDTVLLYGLDTGPPPRESWALLKALAPRLDAVVLDHTYGPNVVGEGHMNAQQVAEAVYRLKEEGLADERTRFFASHISHEGNPAHPQLAEYARQHGYEAAWDGLRVVL